MKKKTGFFECVQVGVRNQCRWSIDHKHSDGSTVLAELRVQRLTRNSFYWSNWDGENEMMAAITTCAGGDDSSTLITIMTAEINDHPVIQIIPGTDAYYNNIQSLAWKIMRPLADCVDSEGEPFESALMRFLIE